MGLSGLSDSHVERRLDCNIPCQELQPTQQKEITLAYHAVVQIRYLQAQVQCRHRWGAAVQGPAGTARQPCTCTRPNPTATHCQPLRNRGLLGMETIMGKFLSSLILLSNAWEVAVVLSMPLVCRAR